MKLSKLILLIGFITLGGNGLLHAQHVNSYQIRKVVIDPGHGGKDPGTTYGKYEEKDIVLNVGLKLGALINKHYPGIEVIYTRTTDEFIPLYKRTDIANKAGADLFISVHVNGAVNKNATGTETFVMGVDKSDDNLDVAMSENSVITFEDDYETRYEGYDPKSAESFIIFSLMQYAYQEQSLSMASLIQKQYTEHLKLSDRGVKQRGFLVIWRTTMPSVLTELGFLSNEKDRKLLTSDSGQETMAKCLFNAFSEYKAQMEKSTTILHEAPAATVTENTAKKTEPEPEPAVTATSATVRYYIQLRSSKTQLSTSSASLFSTYRNKVTEKHTGGLYKYLAHESKTYKEVLSLLPQVKKRFSDAFIVAFDGDRPLDVKQALEITKE